jgi:hypothetical protein
LLTHNNQKDSLEKAQQLKYYYKKLYGQVFVDEKTSKFYHPNIQQINFKSLNQGENYESFSKSTN